MQMTKGMLFALLFILFNKHLIPLFFMYTQY